MAGSGDRGAAHEAHPLRGSSRSQSPEKDEPRQKAKERQQQQENVVKEWRWEICTFILGTAALAAILAMLLSFKNKPAYDVNLRTAAGEIQVTAIIAGLAQIAQSALLVPISYCIGQLKWQWFQTKRTTADLDRFDLASRGPDGCVRLLWHFAWRQRLVSIGAFSTILMLLFPTFVQQSVQEGEKNAVEFNSSFASISRARNVADSSLSNTKLYALNSDGTSSSYEVDTTLTRALERGLAESNPISYYNRWTVGPGEWLGLSGCEYLKSGGECSWGDFKTLGVCSSAKDLTSEITLENHRVLLPSLQNAENNTSTGDLTAFRSAMRGYKGSNSSQTGSFPPSSVRKGTNLPSLAEIYFLYYDTKADPGGFDQANRTSWRAFRGTFQLCIQTLNATQSSSRGGHEGVGMTLVQTTANIQWDKTTRLNTSAFCTRPEGESEDFCISDQYMQKLAFHMNKVFNATANFDGSDHNKFQYSSEWGPYLVAPIYHNDMVNLHNFDRIWPFQDMLEGVAFSLTNKFRSDINYREDIYGTYSNPVTVVLVDFRWFILPAALWVMVAVFFLSTIIATRSTPMWKSSPLPLLSMNSSEGAPASETRIREEAKNTWMKIKKTQQGWQLLDNLAQEHMTGSEETSVVVDETRLH